MAGKKGALSPKTYFPILGDQLEDSEDGIFWECVRANNFEDQDLKETIRYALLKGYAGDEVLWLAVHDCNRTWLDAIEIISKKGPHGTMKKYLRNPETGTWQEA